jgi:hypothetical protein
MLRPSTRIPKPRIRPNQNRTRMTRSQPGSNSWLHGSNGEAWGTPLDWLYGAYARWCVADGKPLLAEPDVLAWLQARGARLTGSGSSGRRVQGLRVTD